MVNRRAVHAGVSREDRDARDRRIVELHVGGATLRDIAAEVGISKSTVGNVIAVAREDVSKFDDLGTLHGLGQILGSAGQVGRSSRCGWCHARVLVDDAGEHAVACKRERDRRGRKEAARIQDQVCEDLRARRQSAAGQAVILGTPLRW